MDSRSGDDDVATFDSRGTLNIDWISEQTETAARRPPRLLIVNLLVWLYGILRTAVVSLLRRAQGTAWLGRSSRGPLTSALRCNRKRFATCYDGEECKFHIRMTIANERLEQQHTDEYEDDVICSECERSNAINGRSAGAAAAVKALDVSRHQKWLEVLTAAMATIKDIERRREPKTAAEPRHCGAGGNKGCCAGNNVEALDVQRRQKWLEVLTAAMVTIKDIESRREPITAAEPRHCGAGGNEGCCAGNNVEANLRFVAAKLCSESGNERNDGLANECNRGLANRHIDGVTNGRCGAGRSVRCEAPAPGSVRPVHRKRRATSKTVAWRPEPSRCASSGSEHILQVTDLSYDHEDSDSDGIMTMFRCQSPIDCRGRTVSWYDECYRRVATISQDRGVIDGG